MAEHNIFKKVMWFDKAVCDTTLFTQLEPKRKVNESPRYKSGIFYSDKCRKDIQYESELELKFFKKLEQNKDVLYYWEQPVTVPYWRGKIKSYTTPDVGIILKNLKVVIVEIKPLSKMLEYKVQMKVEGMIKFCAENGCGFLLTDGKSTIDRIRKTKCNRNLEKELLGILETRIIRKRECAEIMKKHNAKQTDLLKIVLKNELRYKEFPLKLQQVNKNKLFHQIFNEKKRYDDIRKESFNALLKISNTTI